MCGRYASFRDALDLADHFDVEHDDVAEDARLLPPSWNTAPTDAVRVVVEREQGDDGVRRSLRLARWGLVPSWAKDPSIGSRMINARVESLTEKPAFRRAVVARRCLVPAEGWYEWQAPPEGSRPRTPKQPYWIHSADGSPLAFAGLYEFWRNPTLPDDDPHRWLVTMTIVTGGAPTDDPALAAIHDRRPVTLSRDAWDAWLDPTLSDTDAVVGLLHRDPPPFVATPVSTEVNKVGTDGPQLVEPVEV
ncbi:SOS response-associated peptidase [Actinotalea sp. AC32]|nr:SOS response-associated peptidase [Actinotalea sp. AC32]